MVSGSVTWIAIETEEYEEEYDEEYEDEEPQPLLGWNEIGRYEV